MFFGEFKKLFVIGMLSRIASVLNIGGTTNPRSAALLKTQRISGLNESQKYFLEVRRHSKACNSVALCSFRLSIFKLTVKD